LSRKRLLTTFAWVAGAIVAMVGLLWVFQRSLIYLPTQEVPAPPPGVEEVSLKTEDGLSLTAWMVPAEHPRAVVIAFNGNAGNRAHRLPLGEALAARGLTVLLTDYRGYGGNPGSPTEDGLGLDANAARDFARRQFDELPVVYFGESLGAGVAIGLAVEHHPDALILRSPFASLPEIASVHYRWLPTSLLLNDKYQNVERIRTIEVATLVVAGSADRIVPTGQSETVFRAATEPKRLLTIEGAGHNDLALLDGDEMINGIMEFLEETLASP